MTDQPTAPDNAPEFEIDFGHYKPALCSEEDFEHLQAFSWCRTAPVIPYAVTGIAERSVGMHRIVLRRVLGRETADGMVVDHLNGCRHDNRRSNLREATVSENMLNVGITNYNASGFPGVATIRRKGKFDGFRATPQGLGDGLAPIIFENPKDAATYLVKCHEDFLGYVPYRKTVLYEMLMEAELNYANLPSAECLKKMRRRMKEIEGVV